MYKALLFDMDGTLIDTESLYFEHIKNKLAQKGYTLTEQQFIMQMGLPEYKGAELITKSFFPEMTPEEYLQIIDIKSIKYTFQNNQIPVMKGFSEIIEQFQGKLKYAIATGSPTEFLEIMRERFSFDEKFQVLLSSDEVPNGKPFPDIYLEAAKRLGVDIKTCIVLEDAPAGVQAGISAGAYTIAIKSEWTQHFDFSHADFVCNSLLEAMEHIKKQAKAI